MEETNEPRTKEITHTGYPTKHPGRIVDCDLCMRGGEVERVGLVVSKEQADQLENIIIQRAEHWAEARANWFFETDAEYRRNNRADYNSRKAKVFEGAVEEVFGVLGVSVEEQK